MNAPRAVLVVGGGLAALRTVEGLRRRGFAGAITLISEEAHLPYDRPPLSKSALRSADEPPWLRAPDKWRELNVDVHLRERAMSLDLGNRTVVTDSGEYPFETLVIATGAEPRRIPGFDGMVLRTWDDALALRAKIASGAHIGVIGAGLIGCEIAASARAIGAEVHLIDVLSGPVVRVVGEAFSHVLAQLHADHGVSLYFGQDVESVSEGAIALADGTVLNVDLVIESVGARPTTAWLASSGLKLEDGVICDDLGRTSAPGVFAVGDVARWAGHRAEHWSNAVWQASVVSAELVSGESPALEVPYWWSDQYDKKLQGRGLITPGDDVMLGLWGKNDSPVALFSRDGVITAVVGMSAPGAIVRAMRSIVTGTSVDDVRTQLDLKTPSLK